MTETAAARWARELEEWAIPASILSSAPEEPWALPPDLFRLGAEAPDPVRPTLGLARSGLDPGGSVLDVGCGGGAASVPLAPPAGRIAGVDESPAMLRNFAAASAARGVVHEEVEGSWPAVADSVAAADVVVCSNVVYNVAEIAPFLAALTAHARRLVVVELTEDHPTAPMNPLWRSFWGLGRPAGPTADTFLEVVRQLGYQPRQRRFSTGRNAPPMDRAAYVAFVRRRLCLPAARESEVDAAIGPTWPLRDSASRAVAWEPPPSA